MSAFTIDELPIPENLDGEHGDAFREMVEVRNTIEADTIGNRDLNYAPDELLPFWQNQQYNPMRVLVARVDGRVVARAVFELQAEESAEASFISIEVLAEHRRQGIGSALYERLLEWTREAGLRVMQCYVLHRPDRTGPQLQAPTGYGSVPADDPGSRFLVARGFTLEQVDRMSRLPLPLEPNVIDTNLRLASRAAGPDYSLVHWVGRTPDDLVEDLARLRQRMSVDAPAAGLAFAEEEWDAERIRTTDDLAAKSPRMLLYAAVRHEPSGRLVGFTELSAPPELSRPVDQGDTLVIREHRGHRLGMLLKISNLKHLEAVRPGHPSVITFNAEENRYMLAVNEAVGFVPAGYEGGWKKLLD
ncbi:GNAT family N-acetyltransferase [Diaminobutyricimonas sp. TR449]|uniref:GNAT family N-acetyltransferase n=1 Tax=Diaminobutyricimonas sp. TR449 TaxID=2708076 RepID=UPI001420E290|nr:GNAT family N-acetyltransferase [Diaminobutyricimonas sp. TR449]